MPHLSDCDTSVTPTPVYQLWPHNAGYCI